MRHCTEIKQYKTSQVDTFANQCLCVKGPMNRSHRLGHPYFSMERSKREFDERRDHTNNLIFRI